MTHIADTGRMKDQPISETTKKIIQALRKGTRSQSDIAREFGVSRQWVSLVKGKQEKRRKRALRRSKSRQV
jgi:DNA invertase Pin-like site-specific DNA recombinase